MLDPRGAEDAGFDAPGDELRTLADVLSPHDAPPNDDARLLCEELEAQGWGVILRRGDRVRYWCRCRRQHQMWVGLRSNAETYITSVRKALNNKTCFKEPDTRGGRT